MKYPSLDDFMGRKPFAESLQPQQSLFVVPYFQNNLDFSMVLIIVAIATSSVLLFTLIIIKKRSHS